MGWRGWRRGWRVDRVSDRSGVGAVLHVASPSFDALGVEMVWAFGLGATLVVAPADAVAGNRCRR